MQQMSATYEWIVAAVAARLIIFAPSLGPCYSDMVFTTTAGRTRALSGRMATPLEERRITNLL